MKYAIIIPDGCADEPQPSLEGKTPLEAARLPAMDSVVKAGVIARANHTPAALAAGSDTANLSLLGYDPLAHYTGRAPLEAAAQGISLGAGDWAVRCNLVTIEDQVMRDFTAGHVSTEESAVLLASLQEKIGNERLRFLPGVSYRNLLIVKAAPFTADTRTLAPHDWTDQDILDAYPRGPGSALLAELMGASEAVFADHPVNQARRKAGRPPVTNVWLWGQGSAPRLEPFEQVYGVRGAMITAVQPVAGTGQADRLDADRRARRNRLPRHGLRRQGTLCGRGIEGARPGVRSCRGPRRGLARGPRGRQDRGRRADRPAHRGPVVCGLAGLSRVADPGSRPTIPRRSAPRRTATATYPWRWPAAAFNRTVSTATMIERRPSLR